MAKTKNYCATTYYKLEQLIDSVLATKKKEDCFSLANARAGAHTIGVAHCNTFAARLGGGSGSNSAAGADPALNAAYAAELRARCGPAAAAASNNATAVPMDPGSPARFDAHYFVNLKLGRGLFASDAALLADRRAAGMIHGLTRQEHFLREFRNAVRKMGRVGVLTGEHGEIRRHCRAVNSR